MIKFNKQVFYLYGNKYCTDLLEYLFKKLSPLAVKRKSLSQERLAVAKVIGMTVNGLNYYLKSRSIWRR